MKLIDATKRVLSKVFVPLRKNGAFFIFMYILGMVCTYAVLPDYPGFHAYEFAPHELFADLYVLCLLLTILPERLRTWTRNILYVIAYSVAIVDVYCFVKFDSTITPTMLLLVGETNSQEAGEFLASYLTPDIIFSRLGWVLLVLFVHIAWGLSRKELKRFGSHVYDKIRNKKLSCLLRHTDYRSWLMPFVGAVTAVLLCWSIAVCIENKRAYIRLLSYNNIGDVEHELTEPTRAKQYQPVYRLIFSIYANKLTARQIDKLVAGIDNVSVDSCTFRSPNIVLIIGESYNRSHSQLYGYEKETTPRQTARAKKGDLVPFTDVVAPWNLTSFVFKHLFSLYVTNDKGEWCDYPLFPELFRKAGYHVTFITNQFLPQAKEAVYDFSGGFFLNNPKLSSEMFDTRNKKLYYFDEGLLKDYDRLKTENKEHNLTIFHLKGQHVDYRTRCPKSKQKFKKEDYDRPDLTPRQRQIIAYYDNAVLYNDSIVDQIIQRFENDDAIVLYVPDHGEECYGKGAGMHGRQHSAKITARLAREEFEIPMWIYCSPKYITSHPDMFEAIKAAKDKPYMSDAIPHLLLYIAGINTGHYRERLNVISPNYDLKRSRILKHEADYDELMRKDKAEFDTRKMIDYQTEQ